MRTLLDKLFKKTPDITSSPLTAQGLLASDLWLDRPDAHRRIQARRKSREIDAEQAERLAHFVDRGYMTFPSRLPERVFGELQQDVDRLWRQKPADLAFARHGPLRSLLQADEERDRNPSYRIADLHSHSAAALEIYLDPTIFRHVELILGQPPVATQSLYFEYGSQQPLHRDPVFVPARPASHLLAAWVALEDIGPRCGPLVYIPGSHRLPYYQFAPGEYRFDDSRHGEGEMEAMAEFDRRQAAERGLRPEILTCQRGEVLIWHSSLIHGGSVVEDPSLTRKSFVVHFSTLAHNGFRRQRILEPVPGAGSERPRIFESDRILERNGCRGFDNPMRGYQPI